MKFAKHLLAAAATLALASTAQAAVSIVINNLDAAGVGFNDPTPVAPVGGNTGTTLGQQRQIAFAHAANIWGSNLTSSVPIVINASFQALTCTATSAVLGSAGATRVFRDFAGAPFAGTWYSYALANKLFGVEIDPAPGPQINARFNVNLGTPGCLTASPWYYGLDSAEPAGAIDFVAVLQHEMGHGLGFQTFTNGNSAASGSTPPGGFFAGFPAAWDHFLLDAVNNVSWAAATPAQRIASAISTDKLVWTGTNVNTAVPLVLRVGLPGVAISGPAAGGLAGSQLLAGEASFGAPLTTTGVFGEVMPVVTPTGPAGGVGSACGALTVNDARAVNGKIALVDRGACGFAVKVKNAQNAGAIGVLVADNAAGSPPPGLGGSDPTVTISAVRITLADGNALKTQLARRSRTNSGVFARIGLFGTAIAGADSLGRMKMYAVNPFAPGSSVSHYDVSASRNQLMEPSINADLTQAVNPPIDLTMPLFKDIGW
jgi:PA domain